MAPSLEKRLLASVFRRKATAGAGFLFDTKARLWHNGLIIEQVKDREPEE